MDILLNKSCFVYASDCGGGAFAGDRNLIVANHRREEVLASLRGALSELLVLQGISFDVWARQVVWERLRLPKSIRPSEWVESSTGNRNDNAADLNATAIVFDLDSSAFLPGEQSDLLLNTTIASVEFEPFYISFLILLCSYFVYDWIFTRFRT